VLSTVHENRPDKDGSDQVVPITAAGLLGLQPIWESTLSFEVSGALLTILENRRERIIFLPGQYLMLSDFEIPLLRTLSRSLDQVEAELTFQFLALR
jgi:hypothetical protein